MSADFQNFLAVIAAIILVSWWLTEIDLRRERDEQRRRGRRKRWHGPR